MVTLSNAAVQTVKKQFPKHTSSAASTVFYWDWGGGGGGKGRIAPDTQTDNIYPQSQYAVICLGHSQLVPKSAH